MTKAVLSHPARPATTGNGRIILWARKNLFSSWSNSLLTLFCFWLMWELIPPLLNWAFLQANWVGTPAPTVRKREPAGSLFISASASLCMGSIPTISAGASTLR